MLLNSASLSRTNSTKNNRLYFLSIFVIQQYSYWSGSVGSGQFRIYWCGRLSFRIWRSLSSRQRLFTRQANLIWSTVKYYWNFLGWRDDCKHLSIGRLIFACSQPVGLNDLYMFDPSGLEWTRIDQNVLGTAPPGRYFPGFTAAGSLLCLFGGTSNVQSGITVIPSCVFKWNKGATYALDNQRHGETNNFRSPIFNI